MTDPPTTTTWWCERAWVPPGRVAAGVVLHVDGGAIVAVDSDVAGPPGGAERLSGLVLPGFANAHSHVFHRALRGRTESSRGTFWTWRERMYDLAARLEPDTYLALARATFAEMALAGVTAVGEFHYVHHTPCGAPYDDPNVMGLALVEAARDAGVRLTLLDTCYLHGGFGQELEGVQRRFGDGDVGRWVERLERLAGWAGDVGDAHATTRVGAAVHSVRALTPAELGEVAAWVVGRDLPVHGHLSEQRAENEACHDAHGRTPTALMADAGLVDGRFCAVHLTHPEDGDPERLGVSRAFVCLCPTTERDLADGMGPARRLAQAGCRLVVGSDSHVVVDLLEEARAVEMHERLQSGERGHFTAGELVEALTLHGYAALGWPEGGQLARGRLADFVAVRLDTVRTAGTEPGRADDAVVFAATASDVSDVVVGGRVVVRDGVHRRVDDVAGALTAAVRALW